MELEIWKDINFIRNGIVYDYRGIYQISNQGRLRSLDRYVSGKNNTKRFIKGKLKLPTQRQITKNYHTLSASLWKNNKILFIGIHILVARMFVPNPDNKPEVNHKDSNSLNNWAINLEWSTRKENMDHAYKFGGLQPNYKMHEKVVDDYLSLMSSDKISKKHGITKKTVFDVLHKYNIKTRSGSEAQKLRFNKNKIKKEI
jgi:hypothetical protein